jgi:hypothetical protein
MSSLTARSPACPPYSPTSGGYGRNSMRCDSPVRSGVDPVRAAGETTVHIAGSPPSRESRLLKAVSAASR